MIRAQATGEKIYLTDVTLIVMAEPPTLVPDFTDAFMRDDT